MPLTSLVIGDPHFKAKNILDGMDFVERVVGAARERNPSFIVILGDILDTHEVVKVPPHKVASAMIEQLSAISPTYILIGNHDLINHSQFLTDNHIFNPMKKWPNVFIADTIPQVLQIDDSQGNERTFVFCPYTPPGRFAEALNKIVPHGHDWQLADAIFAHQEFQGCKMSKITSEEGDSWDADYPPVISGHIHDSQTVGENVFYPGSAIQHGFGESSGKRIWFVNWEPEAVFDNDEAARSSKKSQYYTQGFSVDKINLGMKSKRAESMTVDQLNEKASDRDFLDKTKKCHLKIKLTGTSDEFKSFRRSKFSATLRKLGVKFSYNLVADTELDSEGLGRATRKDVSYREVLREVVSTRDVSVQAEYKDLFKITPSENHTELVFLDSVTSDSDAGEFSGSNTGELSDSNEVFPNNEEEFSGLDAGEFSGLDAEELDDTDACTECNLAVGECVCGEELCVCGFPQDECEC